MKPIVVSVGPLAAASANNIAHTQTPGAAGPLTLNGALVTGGVAVMDKPRQVLITVTDDEAANTFTISGTDWAASPISEVVTGPGSAGTVASVLSYATVTSIVISGAAGAALTVGTNGVASSPWVRLDGWANPTTSVQCAASGTVNYTVQQSLDDPNYPYSVAPSAMTWASMPDSNLVDATTTIQSAYAASPVFVRCLLNSGAGSVTMTVQQFASATY